MATNEISVNFRGKVGHYRNGSLCYCFSLVGQHLYISSARKFNECQNSYGTGSYDALYLFYRCRYLLISYPR